jgi:hypothetical protein
VRVNSEKQTLILAGEALPQRALVGTRAGAESLAQIVRSQRPLTIVATPADDTLLLIHDNYAVTRRSRGINAADEYARTQELSGGSARKTLIDTYA